MSSCENVQLQRQLNIKAWQFLPNIKLFVPPPKIMVYKLHLGLDSVKKN